MPIADTDTASRLFLEGGGEAGSMIRRRDWTGHPLGPPETWPNALRVTLGIVLNSPESMFVAWGPELFFFFNDTYAPLLGPRLPIAMGGRFADVWADAWDQAKPIVDDALAGHARRFIDLPWTLARQGTTENAWFTFSYSRILDADGTPAGLFCITNETTDRVSGEAARRGIENRNRQILDSATDFAVIATNLDGCVTRWNEGARRVLGWTEEDMLGQVVDRIFTPEDLAELRPQTEMRLTLETGSAADERWHRRKDGARFWANGKMMPLREADHQVVGFVKVLRDQTEQRLADEALRESRARLAHALEDLSGLNRTLQGHVTERTAERDRLWDTSPELLIVLDLAGAIQQVNPAWTTILGYQPEELIGRSVNDFVHPDDIALTQKALANAATGPMPVVENRYRHKDGSTRWISWVAAPADREIYATGRHITADKEAQEALRLAEEQLRQSQKVEAVGQLTGGVAHDFNNLLTVIRGSVDLLRRPNISEERRNRYIEAIADTADRAIKLTSQLLAFARRQTLKPEIFDASASIVAIENMVQTLSGSRIRVSVDLSPDPCFINADRSQFDTAVVNMAVNARDAMNGTGTLTISVRSVSGMPAVRVHPPVSGAFVAVALTDTGTGISAETIDRIFEPFFTTKGVGEGTGLGLSQVFGFAKQSGGEIIVQSREGEGSTFTMFLPLATNQDEGEVRQNGSTSPSITQAACVLVVEDNAEVGSFATHALSELGYHTILAANAETALTELASSSERIDVVFSDVVMPGMSGIELGQEIRRLYPKLPVILTSGYSAVLAETGTHGFELVQKPYSIEELSRVLQKVAVVAI